MNSKISIIVPFYNKETHIIPLYTALVCIFQDLSRYTYELILINDGSTDNSWAMMTQLAKNDSRVKAIDFSRHFGYQIALAAGYDHATGNAILAIDSDLQDPSILIVDMIKAWERGAKIVYSRRINYQNSFIKSKTAHLYYHCLDYISGVKTPHHVTNYGLIDKTVVQVLRECDKKNRYSRRMIAWTGFKHTIIDFNQSDDKNEIHEHSHRIKFAREELGILSLFSFKIASFFGACILGSGLLILGYLGMEVIFKGTIYPFSLWVVTVLYIFMGLQFILLWLISEYIGRIHQQQKNIPLYIIEQSAYYEEKTIELVVDSPHRKNTRDGFQL